MKNDSWIRRMAIGKGMIDPFIDHQVRRVDGNKVISYGLSSYGYDFRLASEFREPLAAIDPKASFESDWAQVSLDRDKKGLDLEPNAFILGRSLEYFKIPRDVIGLVVGKSTYARSGIILNITPLEAEWEGYITLEIANVSPYIVTIYPFEGIGQVLFLSADEICEISYADREGKYQGQKQVIIPQV